MGFIKLENLISPALKRAGVKKQADTAVALERAATAIRDFLGEDAPGYLHPLHIKYRTLSIGALSASACVELNMIEEELLLFVNKGFATPIVDRVRVINL